MLKIEILLSKDEKATQVIADALQAQIEKKFKPLYPDVFTRVRVGTGKKCDISGIKDKDELERINEMLEDIFFSDEWLPEQDQSNDDVEVVMQPKQMKKTSRR